MKREWRNPLAVINNHIGRTALLALLGVCLAPGHVWAGPFDLYGAGARGTAMGSAQTAKPLGPSAIYYNIGALPLSEPTITVGAFSSFGQSAQILLHARPEGYDVPDLGASSPSLASQDTIKSRSDTQGIRALRGLILGGTTDLGIPDLRLGLLLMLPIGDLVSMETHFADERERIFSNQLTYELIDQRVHRLDIEVGGAYRVTEWLSAGIGATVAPGTSAKTQVYLKDPTNQELIHANSDVVVSTAFGLLAGLVFNGPWEPLTLGVSYRASLQTRNRVENALVLLGVDTSGDTRQNMDWTPSYSPAMVNVGLSWDSATWSLALDGRYTRWSDYRDTQNHRPGFDDTIAPRMGLEYAYSESTRLRLGLGWEPSPVPDQNGRTNYVDNDRIMGSVGSEHTFNLGGHAFRASWFVQFHHLLTRQTTKTFAGPQYDTCSAGTVEVCDEVDDNFEDPETGQVAAGAAGLQTGNPGFPGFTSGGWIGSVGGELQF